MSIEVRNGMEMERDNKSRVHWLPVQIDAPNGVHQAQSDQYFSSQIQQSNEGLTASFRGRKLNGEVITFPDEYKCFVVDETRKPLSEDATRKLHTSSKFTKMTYWNWDQQTSKNDKIRQMLDWVEIAEELHKAVDETT